MRSPTLTDLTAPIAARGEAILGFVRMLAICPSAESRRRLIIVAHDSELINDDDAEILLKELAS